MRVRLCSLALTVIASALPAYCDCPKDVAPPGVIQFKNEVGTRPLNVVVREAHLVNVYHAMVDEQQQIANSLVGFCFPENQTAELADRIRDSFQRHGFFKVHVSHVQIESLDRSANPPTVSVTARVDEGPRYRLREIHFTGNRAVTNTAALRRLIPIKDDDIFNIELVRDGLKNLRDAYGNLGYINFTPVPDTQIDDEKSLITLTLDLDEGPPFVINSFKVIGADPQREAALQAAWPESLQPGKVYNSKLVNLFFKQAQNLLPPGATAEHNLIVRQNSREHTVDIILALGPH